MEPIACFVSASNQNAFFGELLDALAEALEGFGVAVERAVDHFPELRDELVYVFVPHELLPMLMPDGHPSEPQLQRSVTICTEQPGTAWFAETVRISERAAATVDINRLGVAALEKAGVTARFLQLGYVPRWDRWKGARDQERSVEVTFLAGVTPRREQALGRCARVLAGRTTELHLPESVLPHKAGAGHFIEAEEKWDLLSRSKLIVNVHRDELRYFEWQRAIEAIVNGCVLLSEHSLGFEPLEPGKHFISVSCNSLDIALEALLDDRDRLDQIRSAAYDLVREDLPLSDSIAVLAEAIEDVARRPIDSAARARTGAIAPRPKQPQLPPPEYERLANERTELDVLRMATKQLLLDQREMRRSLRDLHAQVIGETASEDLLEEFGTEPSVVPRVSVVLTVYNYEALVGTAIHSVAASDLDHYELVIVDDASSDGSDERIRAALHEDTWMRARLITRTRNGGLAAARNRGVEAADAELVFILDADNAVYPHTLRRLAEALDEDADAMFAYGIIEQFGLDGATGLMSYLDWDPLRLRYGNFVDAMAMIRRSALLEAGGYVSDSRLYGWEDFALWCAFADRGWKGTRVPEIIARYRLAMHSMISLTNIDVSAAWSVLLDRYQSLSANAEAPA